MSLPYISAADHTIMLNFQNKRMNGIREHIPHLFGHFLFWARICETLDCGIMDVIELVSD
jgi:hypothetical protein